MILILFHHLNFNITHEEKFEFNGKLMQLIGVNGDDSGMENSSQL